VTYDCDYYGPVSAGAPKCVAAFKRLGQVVKASVVLMDEKQGSSLNSSNQAERHDDLPKMLAGKVDQKALKNQ
jgi:hypothetical protein